MGDLIRGISTREEAVWLLFRLLASGDFKHDFGKDREKGRDLFVLEDENRFLEIAKHVTKKGNVWLKTNFRNNAVKKTLFEILGGTFYKILPPLAPGRPPNPENIDFSITEEKLFELVTNNDFDKVKRLQYPEYPGPLTFNTPSGIPRSYTLRSSSYRQSMDRSKAEYKMNRNIAAMFQEVTGKKKFALIIDASGGLPLTDILNTSLLPEPEAGVEFYIIENIENASDSATKLTNIKRNDAKPALKPTLRFLKDSANTVVYPIWENSADPKSNLHSSVKVVLNRVANDETEADIEVITGGKKSVIHIGDVSSSSNVKNASLRAYAEFLEKGANAVDPYIFTLIKRMGDWCQGLSLLDLDREYDVLDQTRVSEGRKLTLRSMLVDTEIGIVTNDRILLSYCLLHGINVFYTTAMDVASLVYFKNNNDVPDGPSLDNLATELKRAYDGSPENQYLPRGGGYPEQLRANVYAYEAQITAEPDIGNYILKLRNYFSNVAKLRTEFTALDAQAAAANSILNPALPAPGTPPTPMERFNAINTLISLATKQRVDIDHDKNTIRDLQAGNYSGMQTDRIRIESLQKKLASGARITKSVEVVEAKNILLSIRDDIRQLRLKGFIEDARMAALLRDRFQAPGANDRVQSNYDEIMSVMPTIKLSFVTPLRGGGAQKGGGLEQLGNVYNAIRTRSIRLIPPDVEEQTSTVNFYKTGDVYYDEKLKPYTVSDEYIVTDDDLPTFDLLFTNFVNVPADGNMMTYVYIKYLLLRLDLLEHEFEKLKAEYSEDISKTNPDVDRAFEVGEPAFTQDNTIQNANMVSVRNTVLKLAGVNSENYINLAHELYNKEPIPDVPVAPGENVIQKMQEAFATARNILGNVILRIPAGNKRVEQTQTRLIQKNATLNVNSAENNAGFLREALAQRIQSKIRLTPDELESLGETIENAAKSSAAITVTDETRRLDDATVIAKINNEMPISFIVDSIEDWTIERGKTLSNNTRVYLETVIRQILAERQAAPPVELAGRIGKRKATGESAGEGAVGAPAAMFGAQPPPGPAFGFGGPGFPPQQPPAYPPYAFGLGDAAAGVGAFEDEDDEGDNRMSGLPRKGKAISGKSVSGPGFGGPPAPGFGFGFGQGGGSRARRPLYSNVQASNPPQSKSRTHSRLRKRAKTRRARRIRKSARKSKTRR